MKIKYEIEEYEPEREYILVKYTSPEDPELLYYKSLNPPDFSAEKLMELITAVGQTALGFWERAKQHELEMPIEESAVIDVEPEVYLEKGPVTVYLPQPEYDPWTEYVVQEEVTSPFQAECGWEIIKLEGDELAEQYEYMENAMRYERNDYLAQTDFVHLPDAGVGNLEEWLEFRQALRDLPETAGWPKAIEWPTQPLILKE